MKDTNHTQSEERRVAEALEAMRKDAGDAFKLEAVNLAEMERRTGLSRSRLRRLKKNGFEFKPHANKGRKAKKTILSGFTGALDDLLRKGVSNSSVILERLKELGYPGGLTVVKEYIARHKNLLPPKRQVVAPQGNRGRRYETPPGDSFQMDWGFTNVVASTGGTFQCACFVMTCHHCGACYVEFFPNAKQENLFIGMIHGFERLGVPAHVLTDNMKSVVLHRDLEGQPVWHSDYDAFMHTVGFQTKICKPRHPFTKGKVERLVRFVKENFLAGRTFYNVTDLNRAALEWCDKQNGIFHRGSACVPNEVHGSECAQHLHLLDDSRELQGYLCPLRKISFDGFVNYEGRRFGVPYQYTGSFVRVMRKDAWLYIYSEDLLQLLVSHEVTWSKCDRFCKDQYAVPQQPEEFPTAPVKTQATMLPEDELDRSFEKFNFSKGADSDD